jgi:hypothetical protein
MFQVAIPSYQRPEKLRDTTLKYLASEEIPAEIITVFVASEEEKKKYLEYLVPGTFGALVVGVPTISAQRQFIRDYYQEGQAILSIDDDIKKLKMMNPRPLKEVVEQLFTLAREELCTFWGIYPVNNLFFCKERVIKGRTYIIGCFYGFWNKKDCSYPQVCGFEDKWMSIKRVALDGAVLRYEGVCPDTTYYAKGGISELRRQTDHELTQARKVVAEFPDECSLKLKKNQHWEVLYPTKIFKKLSLFPPDESL